MTPTALQSTRAQTAPHRSTEAPRPSGVRKAERPVTRDDGFEASVAPRAVVSATLREQFRRLVMTRELTDLTTALEQLLPATSATRHHGLHLDTSFKRSPHDHALVGAVVTARAGDGLGATRLRFSAFSHELQPNGARQLRSHRLNWVEDADVRSDSVRVLIERDASGQALDGGTRYQELVLSLEASGRVSAVTVRNGNHRALKSVWPSQRVELAP